MFGGGARGLVGWMKEWTTARPRIDSITNELILFHSTFITPFVHYSIIPSTYNTIPATPPPRLVSATVPGIKSAKMMHDFGVSLRHTAIMDLPLSLDPRNLARNEPVISYDPSSRSRLTYILGGTRRLFDGLKQAHIAYSTQPTPGMKSHRLRLRQRL